SPDRARLVASAGVVHPRAYQAVRVIDPDAVDLGEHALAPCGEEAQDGARARSALHVPARVEDRVAPGLALGRRPAGRRAHAMRREEESRMAPLVLAGEADGEVAEETQAEAPRRGGEMLSLAVGDELREPEERDRVGVGGADRAPALRRARAPGIPEPRVEAFPRAHVAGGVRLAQCLEELVALEPVRV